MIYIFLCLFICSYGCNSNNIESSIKDTNINFNFFNASDRATAYIENQKIVSRNGHIFSFLDYMITNSS